MNNIPTLEELNSNGKRGRLYIEKHWPHFYKYLLDTYQGLDFKEALYIYYHPGIKNTCELCGNKTKFISFDKGYQKYCSLKCSNNSTDVKNKKIQSNIEHYGIPYASQNKSVKEKMIKTYTDKHGGMGNASEEVKEKQQDTMLERYGSKHALCVESIVENMNVNIKDKYGSLKEYYKKRHNNISNVMLERYGIESYMNHEDFKIKSCKTKQLRYNNPYYNNSSKASDTKRLCRIEIDNELIGYTADGDMIRKCPYHNCNKCKEKNYIIPYGIWYDRKRDNVILCTKLLPIQDYKGANTSLEVAIKYILDKYNIEYQYNVRGLLSDNKELDIYIPSKNIAIECNGIYCHSTKVKSDKKYHYNKYIDAKNHNIQLIQIWEDWVKTKPDIVESIILSKLGIYKERIYARECTISTIDKSICSKFLKDNHIQGNTNSCLKYGLYYNDQLVSVMTFSKSKKGDWILSRFCNKLHTQVIGGASKLLKCFIRDHNPSSVISFASNDISDGNLYNTLGFTKITTNQSYWYIDNNFRRYHRENFMKSNLKHMGYDVENKTEYQIMNEIGYYCIYDAGITKWELLL